MPINAWVKTVAKSASPTPMTFTPQNASSTVLKSMAEE